MTGDVSLWTSSAGLVKKASGDHECFAWFTLCFWWQGARGGTGQAVWLCSFSPALLSPLTELALAPGNNLRLSKESHSLMRNVSLLEVSLSSLTNLLCFAAALVIYNHGNDAQSSACLYLGL